MIKMYTESISINLIEVQAWMLKLPSYISIKYIYVHDILRVFWKRLLKYCFHNLSLFTANLTIKL